MEKNKFIKGKALKQFLDNVEVVGKAKVTLVNFETDNIKKSDVTRFCNLWRALRVKVQIVDVAKKIKGQTADVVVVDEAVKWKK